ncbi:MAG: hypothetical protein OER21_02010 [Gemmatimonadota bacterium]|nr:hypothetical protein [Gemmatimonadota bacterium]
MKKLSTQAQQELEVLTQARRKVDRLHSLVEQYAAMKKGQDAYAALIARAATELGRLLLLNGMGVMADSANQLAMLAKRGGATQGKIRGLREYVANLRPAVERAEKAVHEREASIGRVSERVVPQAGENVKRET